MIELKTEDIKTVNLFVVNSDRNGMRRMVLIVKHCLINNTVKGVSA